MSSSTRRNFLKTTAVTAASMAALKGQPLWGAPADEIQAWTTTKTKKFEKVAAPRWRAGGTDVAIRIDPAQRSQQVLGFGAAFTDASCYLFSKLTVQERKALLAELFGPSGLRLSVCRTCIGSSDYSTSAYSFDDSPEPDPELKKFSIEHDRAYILPTLREAREVNPDLFLFSSPWSPPGWMKAGNSLLGGNMRKEYFAPYAQYFVKFLQGYAADGVKINAVTVQNEVDTDQNGRMPAALWGQEYEIEFVKSCLGPAFERTGIDTKIWILDHNYNLWGRVMDELSDPDLYKYVDGVAWHGYFGTPDSMTRVQKAYPAKHAYWTEGGPDYTSPDYATDWTKWSRDYSEILRNSAECIVGWNLVLDENGKPNIGPFSCGGMVTMNSKTHALTRSGQYWAFAHYSKTVERGARVIASTGDVKDISHVAFENPDGARVLVITNQGGEQKVSCAMGSDVLDVSLDGDSVTTLLL
jgi:glucosylceramidase